MSNVSKADVGRPEERSPALQVRRDPMPMSPITVDESLGFVHPQLIEAFAYWRACCRSRSMPERSDFRPSDMRPYIAHVAFVDVREQAPSVEYFVRVAGSKIEEVFGKRTGRLLLDDVPKELHPHWLKPFDIVRTTGRPVRGNGQVTFRAQFWLNAEILYAPLGREGAVPSTIFFVLAATRVKVGPR